jgi:hypothetical protein
MLATARCVSSGAERYKQPVLPRPPACGCQPKERRQSRPRRGVSSARACLNHPHLSIILSTHRSLYSRWHGLPLAATTTLFVRRKRRAVTSGLRGRAKADRTVSIQKAPRDASLFARLFNVAIAFELLPAVNPRSWMSPLDQHGLRLGTHSQWRYGRRISAPPAQRGLSTRVSHPLPPYSSISFSVKPQRASMIRPCQRTPPRPGCSPGVICHCCILAWPRPK